MEKFEFTGKSFEIIEENGKYFMVFDDERVEVTREQLAEKHKQAQAALQYLNKHSEAYKVEYGDTQFSIKEYCEGTHDSHVRIRIMQDELIQTIEKEYNKSEDKDSFIRINEFVFESIIMDQKGKLENPYIPDKDVLKRSIIMIETVKTFLLNLHNVYKGLGEIVKAELEPQISGGNDYLLSTVDDYLNEFRILMSKSDYQILAFALKHYFENGIFPPNGKPLTVGKVNMKKFGWALNQLYKSQKAGKLTFEYLKFAKENIAMFSKFELSESNFTKSRLYKYFTTKT